MARAHGLAPQERSVALLYAAARLRKGDAANAAKLLEPFAASEADPVFLETFADALMRSGQLDRARGILEKLLHEKNAGLARLFQLADLYAGAGLFAVAAAVTRGASVFAVEADKHAADDLHANAAAAGVKMTSVRGPVEGFAASAIRVMGRRFSGPLAETVIVDPPRTGMSREALDGAIGLGARRMVYVSCDVATLARDARRIVDGGFRISRADAFDLFPNTPHVETVVTFDR